MANKYLEVYKKVSDIFNAQEFDERKRTGLFMSAQQLLTFEQAKEVLKRNYERQRREITDWQNNIVDTINRELYQLEQKEKENE